MGRGDQLLGVSSLRAFETGCEAVITLERAGRGAEVALACLEPAFPHGARRRNRHACSSLEILKYLAIDAAVHISSRENHRNLLALYRVALFQHCREGRRAR